MKKIIVTVTDSHVRRGECSDAHKCAVAKALIDTGFKGVTVYPSYVSFYASRKDAHTSENLVATINLPAKVTKFIDEFDGFGGKSSRKELASKLKAKPLTFVVNLRDEAAKQVLRSK